MSNHNRRIELNLQHFAAEPELTKSANINVTPREINFVTSFSKNWQALLDVMGVTRLVEKQPGQVLKSKRAKVVLKSGNVKEGEVIPYSESFVETVDYEELKLEKYKKAVSIETLAEHGYEDAIRLTDDEFAAELQADVMRRYYAYIKTGMLREKVSTFQMALSMARSKVLNKWKKMHRTVTDIVGFCNIDDVGQWLGETQIGAQVTNQYGMTYMKNWIGYGTLFLCSDDEIPRGNVVATPVNNIISYYINPGHQDFGRAGLTFVVDGETPIIGFKTVGNYTTDVSENNALMGLRLFSEYQDGIAVVSFGTVTDGVTVNAESGATNVFGTSVSDLQSNVAVNGDKITGTLKYYDDETKALVSNWGAGNFLALKFTNIDTDATSVMVGLEPSQGSGLVELINDPDKNGVFKITNKDTQKFKIVTSDGEYKYTQYFDLSGLTVEGPAGA